MKISEVVRDFFGGELQVVVVVDYIISFPDDPIYTPFPQVQNNPGFYPFYTVGRFTTQVGEDQYYQGIPYNTLTNQWCFGRFTTQVRENMYFWTLHD